MTRQKYILFFSVLFCFAETTYASPPKLGGIIFLIRSHPLPTPFVSIYSSLILEAYDERLKVISPPNIGLDPAVDLPWAKREVAPKLNELLKKVDVADIFIFGHHNNAEIYLLTDVPEELRHKIRLVYNSGCVDGVDKSVKTWLKLGVATFVGHPGDDSASEYFVTSLMNCWLNGDPLSLCVNLANWKLEKNLLLQFQGRVEITKARWGGNGTLDIYAIPPYHQELANQFEDPKFVDNWSKIRK